MTPAFGVASLPGFKDPFQPQRDVTLDNPQYRVFGWSLMKGKLDWLLIRASAVNDMEIGNNDYHASDHKWIRADIVFEK